MLKFPLYLLVVVSVLAGATNSTCLADGQEEDHNYLYSRRDFIQLAQESPTYLRDALCRLPQTSKICGDFHDRFYATPGETGILINLELWNDVFDVLYVNDQEFGELYKSINNWVALHALCNSLFSADCGSIEFMMDILYDTEKGKALIDGCLVDAQQGPESLSSTQMDYVYFEYLNWASTQPMQRRLKIVKAILALCQY